MLLSAHLSVPQVGSREEGRHPQRVLPPAVGPPLHQQPHHLRVPAPRRDVHWRPAVGVRAVQRSGRQGCSWDDRAAGCFRY
jgi:hypothetical protein